MTGNIPSRPSPAAGQNGTDRDSRQDQNHAFEDARSVSLEKLFFRAAQQVPAWTTITLRLPDARQDTLNFSIDQGDGGRPDLRSQLTLDIHTGQIVRWEPFSSYNRGRQLRLWLDSHTLARPSVHSGRPSPQWFVREQGCWCSPGHRLLCDALRDGRAGTVPNRRCMKSRLYVLDFLNPFLKPVPSCCQFSGAVPCYSPFLRVAFAAPATMPCLMEVTNFWDHKNVSIL